MRTTINLDDDVLQAARAISQRRRRPIRYLITLASAAALLASCGATAEEGSALRGTSIGLGGKETMSREDNHEPAGFDPDEDEAGSSGIVFFDEDAERRPIKEIYNVFSRPRNDADRQAGELAARWRALHIGGVEEAMRPPAYRCSDEWFNIMLHRRAKKRHAGELSSLDGNVEAY